MWHTAGATGEQIDTLIDWQQELDDRLADDSETPDSEQAELLNVLGVS